jgi:hypothetical protein
MNRITPQGLVEEYKKSDLTPIKGAWTVNVEGEDGKRIECGCAFTAIMKNENLLEEFVKIKEEDADYKTLLNFVGEKTKYTTSYALGFVHAYDGHDKQNGGLAFTELDVNVEEYDIGYEDGQLAWELVLKELLNGKEIW